MGYLILVVAITLLTYYLIKEMHMNEQLRYENEAIRRLYESAESENHLFLEEIHHLRKVNLKEERSYVQ